MREAGMAQGKLDVMAEKADEIQNSDLRLA